ncbi:MAG: hypothetical protein M3Y33_02255 [Actinomycetota bacterium]|nr:hypothetical protein [Actinomycetota bacterium]
MDRIVAALATLTTQGRAVGKIALRLDEPSQVDMVLGDGTRDRGAFCDEISADPPTGAGVAYVRLETAPDPVRSGPRSSPTTTSAP